MGRSTWKKHKELLKANNEKRNQSLKASFEESLNLLDDALLQYIKKDYYEKLGKGLNNGKPSIGFRIKSILYSILFVFGCNFLLVIFASSLDVAEPKDLTLPVHKPSLLTPEFIPYLLFYLGYHSFLLENLCENHFFDHTDSAFMLRPL